MSRVLRRQLSEGARNSIARKQARYMQMFGDEDPNKIAALISAKGDDYYRLDKFPDQALVGRAEADFQGFRTGTDDMNVLADDMRRFYGMNAQPPATVQPAATIQQKPPVVVREVSEGPMQGPVEAQRYKDDYVKEVVDNYPVDDMKFVDDALRKIDEDRGNDLDTALLALAAAGVGASGVAVAQPKEQEVTPEQIMALQQAGLL